MPVDRSLLTGLGVTVTRVSKFLPDLRSALQQHHIDTQLRIAHFLGQVLHESQHMKRVEENLNYSATGLRKTFPKYFRTASQANAYARKPRKIANRVYGGRMGNGDEDSGDGYRYRGRGLIQLTGKSNYREFSRWIDDDVVAKPDKVAQRYAIQSTVFYWTTRGLNALADVDDIKKITKTINGGYNGLADRLQLVDQAKSLLGTDQTIPATVFKATHIVTATQLNFRNQPRVSSSTKISALSEHTEVMKIAAADTPGWAMIRVMLNGTLREGYVSAKYIKPIVASTMAEVLPPQASIPAVHLKENRSDITRARDGGRAYPLGESRRPRRSGVSAKTKVRRLIEIINYLDSVKKAHKRYQPKSGTTYCNIYAYDYCYLSGVYLPRIWWSDLALVRLANGEDQPVSYGKTVRELNANALHDWFTEHGSHFGWRNVIDLDSLQAAANLGDVCIIVAQRKDLNRSGHIVAVAPEHDAFQARRNAAGEILSPVESQAGSKNHRFVVKPSAWWRTKKFRAFGFWRHP